MEEEVLRKAEKIIKRVASTFQIDGCEFEDLIQIGRIRVWETIKRRGITPQNFKDNTGLIFTAVKQALIGEWVKSRAKKRISSRSLVSLDQVLKEGSDATLHDILGGDENIETSLNEESLKKISHLALKTRDRNAIRGTIWLLVGLLNIERRNIPLELNSSAFAKFNLRRFFWVFFNNSPYKAINYAYPGEFLPHEMKMAPMRHWKGGWGRRRAIIALRQALESTNYDPKNYPKILTWKFLRDFDLGGATTKCFNGNLFEFLNAAFPGIYHPWELTVTNRRVFDSEEIVARAVRWLVEEILGFDIPNMSTEEIWTARIGLKISVSHFRQYGLNAILTKFNTVREVLQRVYPGKFMTWSFRQYGKWSGVGGRVLAGEATRWLIEKYSRLSPCHPSINSDFFRRYGLWGMLTDKGLGFNSSSRKALKNAYPNLEL